MAKKSVQELIAEAKAKGAEQSEKTETAEATATVAEPIADPADAELPFEPTENPKTSTAVAVASTASTTVAVAGDRYTIDDVDENGGMLVNQFVKAANNGIITFAKGDATDGVTELQVAIKLDEVAVCHTIRETLPGNKVEYFKSYDRGATDSKSGLPWEKVLEGVAARGNPSKSFKSFDVPMTVLNDVTGALKKSKLASAGEKIGHSTSPSEERGFAAALKAAVRTYGSDAEVAFKLVGKAVTNKDKQTYGVLELELIGA